MSEALRSLTIYGASDDCLEVEGYIDDEFDASQSAILILTAPDDARLIVAAEFCPDAQWRSHGEGDSGWVLQVHHSDPKWTYPVRLTFRPDRDTSPAIELDVPAGTTITKWDDE
ncbi:hypothetical protein [Nocardia brasiliensis]|uniref:hypothetical protein n=1 Tax=Nocardia brasiliensis TaxID=37326 RepID=UPI0024538310|nr:hypothetical protein [Nocardia brasiliensis]